MHKFKIGWAEEGLVPDKKVNIFGQFYERISEYVESEISVTAMAVESGSDAMILASVDIVGLDSAMVALIRKHFAALEPSLDPRNLIVCATHTHTSIGAIAKEEGGFSTTVEVLSEFFPPDKLYKPVVTADSDIMTSEEGGIFVAQKVAMAAHRAWENRQEALYANEFGRAVVGMCRRTVYEDGSGEMWGDTNRADFVSLEGGNDSGIELLYTFDKDKKLTGVVANIACPAQILEQRSFISADYWGRTKAILREKLGDDIYLLGLCGAGGDQCPRDLIRWVEPETLILDPNVKRPNYLRRKGDPSMYDISGCNRVGRRIAHEILDVYEQIDTYHAEPVFSHKVIDLELPLRKATIGEYNAAVRELEYYAQQNMHKESLSFVDSARMHVYAGTITRFRQQQHQETYPIEYHVIRLGDIAIATSPFELFLDYGNRIKARSPAEQTFIVQLCCGVGGYLPTEKAEKAGHYSAYISSGNVGHEGGDLLVRNTLSQIKKLFQEETK